MDGRYWFILFAIAQGSAVMGFTFFIFLYYVPKKKSQLTNIRLHVTFISLSYICLTIATILTAITGLIQVDFWYWIVLLAYIIGDVALIYIFRACAKRDAHEKIKNKKL
jgi:hypothetical protein